MGNVLVENNTLKDIADSIREKNHSEDRYKPGDMPGAIDQIKTGGSMPDASLPVKFYDYDGTLLYSFSLEEVQNLTNLPELPEHQGLIGQGWNWTPEQIKAENGAVNIGAHYITDDGSTRLYIRIDTHDRTPVIKFGQSKAYGVTVDWGDGSDLELSSKVTTSYYSFVTMSHEYQNEGVYVITLLPDEDTTLTIASNTTNGAWIIGSGGSYPSDNKLFSTALDKVELGRNVILGENAFNSLANLKTINMPSGQSFTDNRLFFWCQQLSFLTVPSGVTAITTECFQYCYGLGAISFPYGLVEIRDSAFNKCYSLREVVLPKTMTTLGKQAFVYCTVLEKVLCNGSLSTIMEYCFSHAETLRDANIFSGEMTCIDSSVFDSCGAMRKVVIPATVTEIRSGAFYLNYALTDVYIFCEEPPVIAANIFNQASDRMKIYVKKGLADTYKQADVWVNFANKIIEME